MLPNDREMYASELGNRTSSFSPDYHSVSSFSLKSNGNQPSENAMNA